MKRSPRRQALRRCAVALAALLALAALACDRGGAPSPGSGHGAGASQARSLPPPSAAVPPASPSAPAPGRGAGIAASREASEPAPPSGTTGIPGERPANEMMPRPQSVRIGEAPPAPAPARDLRREQRDLAARERHLAERQAAVEARERRLSRHEESRAAAASGGPAMAGATSANGTGAGPGDTGVPARTEASPAPGSAAAAAAGAPAGLASPSGEPGAASAPAPETADRQPPVPVMVPAGTSFEVEFTKGLASNASSVGDTFRARVVADVSRAGAIAIPAGSEVLGVVTDAVGARRIGGKARLTVKFTDLVLPSGSTLPVHASFLEEGRSKAGRDAATIGGSTAGGALLGRILSNGSRGTILGALVGAAVGTAIASKTAGEEVVIPEGSVISLKLDQPLAVDARRSEAPE